MIILATTNLTTADVKQKLSEIFPHYSGKKEELIPIMQETQEKFRYLPEEAMREISRFLRIPESTVYGVCTFYAQFKLTPLGRKIVRICRGTACHVRGGSKILEEVEKQLGIKAGETTKDLEYTLETIACFGSCALAPVMVIDKNVYGRMTTSKVKSVLADNE
ncbi:NADH-quinone oxidoreductase subunit NuoE [Chloroflexota bacterium]